MDNEINSLAVEIAGTNVSTAYIYSPKNQSASLGISHPFIVILLKNMKRYFTMEITVQLIILFCLIIIEKSKNYTYFNVKIILKIIELNFSKILLFPDSAQLIQKIPLNNF